MRPLGNSFATSCFRPALRNSCRTGLVIALALFSPRFVRAQSEAPLEISPKPPQESPESELFDGLLELTEQPQPIAPQIEKNPLIFVRQLMENATESLRSGKSLQETSEVQTEIVRQLDQLIDSLLETSSTSAQTMQNAQSGQQQAEEQHWMEQSIESESERLSQQPDENSPDSSAQAGSSDGENQYPSQEDELTQTGNGTSAGDNPGSAGTGDLQSARLADSGELQQSVWGHLPEKIRSQMQSRMVEQFLPSYRQQIEAYYRALLGQETEPRRENDLRRQAEFNLGSDPLGEPKNRRQTTESQKESQKESQQ